jgi:hypothetical protein
MTSRHFRDSVGCAWTAWSVRPDGNAEAESMEYLPRGMRDGWLVFARGMERRRLAPIPDGWWRCDEDELWELCQEAEMVRAYAAIAFPI